MKIRRLLVLALGHMTSDLYPGMLSPLLPIILHRYGLSMTMAGVLIMVLQFPSNLSQPFFGFVNDNRPIKSLMWIGLIVSAVPFGLLLDCGRIEIMIAALALSGIGVGMFHPVAVVAAGKLTKESRGGISMALFSSGGSFGFMIAPLVVVVVVEGLGENYLPLVIIPALIMTAVLMAIPGLGETERHRHSTIREWFSALAESRRELFILFLVATFSSVVTLNIGAFLPIFSIARGASYVKSAYFLSGTLLASMVGMFIGGYLSDIHGRRKILAVTLLISSPLLFLFIHSTGILSMVSLFIGMGAMSCTTPISIVLAQRAAPKHASIASSIVMGTPFAVAALVSPFFGALADKVGIELAMNMMVIIPLLGGVTVFFLKQE